MSVRPKKHLGQHFLNDENIARKIADTLSYDSLDKVLEIGPGMGVLTRFILQKNTDLYTIEIDTESVLYLEKHFPELQGKIIAADFLNYNLSEFFGNHQVAIIGNFPYHISTQIVFKALEFRHHIVAFAGMFQKEVAQRICEKPGSKAYGILSVLVQAYYHTEYLFTVSEKVFTPPPKVQSGVIRLTRKENYSLDCDEKLFFTVVKTAFNQRRKTLRNSLKSFLNNPKLKEDSIFDLRPEQLSFQDFIQLTQKISADAI